MQFITTFFALAAAFGGALARSYEKCQCINVATGLIDELTTATACTLYQTTNLIDPDESLGEAIFSIITDIDEDGACESKIAQTGALSASLAIGQFDTACESSAPADVEVISVCFE